MHSLRKCSDQEIASLVGIISARYNQIVARIHSESFGHFSRVDVAARRANPLQLTTVEPQTRCLILIHWDIVFDLEHLE